MIDNGGQRSLCLARVFGLVLSQLGSKPFALSSQNLIFGGDSIYLGIERCNFGGNRPKECLDNFLGFLDESAPYLGEYQEELHSVIGVVLPMVEQSDRHEEAEQRIHDSLKRGLGRE